MNLNKLVIIPAYNEGEKIASVIKEVKASKYDVLVVDDGSKDNTSKIAKEAGDEVLVHLINRGQGASLRTGVKYAQDNQYNIVIFFDADGQMATKDIAKLIDQLIKDDLDVVLGSRFKGQAKNIPLAKLITLKLALIFTKITTGLKLSDVHNGFQVWKVESFNKLNLVQDRQAYASEFLQEIADQELNYCEVPVTIQYTEYSKGKGQSIFNAFNIILDLIFRK